MSRCKFAWTALLLLLVILILGARGVRAATTDPELAEDEKTLREAGVPADGPGVLAFFRKRVVPEAERKALEETVRRLGDDSFDVREQASRDLSAAGPAAVPFLRAALHDPDLEIVRRAEECLARIEQGRDLAVLAAAARVLADRRPEGAAEVLLAYLPLARDEVVAEAVGQALAVVGVRDGKADPALVAALTEREPRRRAAAAAVLGVLPAQRAAVRRLLTDAEVPVRFQAASALVRGGDRTAVAALIASLGEGPPEVAYQAEDLLCRLVEEPEPPAALGLADPEDRRKCRAAWDRWWKANENKADLSRLGQAEEAHGLTVVCAMQGGTKGTGRVWEFDADNKVRWQIDDIGAGMDVQALANGRVLVAEFNGKRVTERDYHGKVFFKKEVDSNPVSCQRLANGNTFIATYNEVLEVTPKGDLVYAHKPSQPPIYFAQKQRNGHILLVNSGGEIMELSPGGEVIRRILAGDTSNWGSVEALANGHFLVARCGVHEVAEIDAAGKDVWKCQVSWPTWASRLRNGHTLVVSAQEGRLSEFDRAGKEVWNQVAGDRPCRFRRH